MEEISSTTPSVDELKLHRESEYGTEDADKLFDDAANYLIDTKEAEAREVIDEDEDDILDLAGGALDAIERHRSTLPRSNEDDYEPVVSFRDPTPTPELEPEPSAPEQEVEEPELIGGFGDASEKQSKTEDTAGKEEETTPVQTPVKAKSKSSTLVDLVYWRDIQRTGVVFGASLFLLLSLTACSIVSVLAYVALALLSVTISFRIYKGILQAIQKSEDGHPFKMYLDQDIAVPAELVHKYSDGALARLNHVLATFRHLFLVEDFVDSLKFAVLMWILTYIGALFNGLTLLILGLIVVFSWPIIYERHQTQIDHYYGLVTNQVKGIVGTIQAKIPGMKPKTE